MFVILSPHGLRDRDGQTARNKKEAWLCVPEGLRTNPTGMSVDFLFFMIVF